MTRRLSDPMTGERPTLDWVPRHDPRSLNYPIRALVAPDVPLVTRSWQCRVHLNQGESGACVGHAWAHEIAALPVSTSLIDERDATDIYQAAQRIDEWEGESYSGTSVLAGAKAVQAAGWMGEYRWAFGLDDTLRALQLGPVVLGVWWRQGMWDTDEKGRLHVIGERVGGHAILARGVNVRDRTVRLHNSWGAGWGVGGSATVGWDDLATLLAEDGEACAPVVRLRPKL